MTYNSKVLHEQGGSVLRVDSGGSISVQAGGTISGAGTMALTGAVTHSSSVDNSGSLTLAGAFFLGGCVQILFGYSVDAPTVLALPGSIFFRSNGSVSNIYVNTGVDNAGSVWSSACLDTP